MLELVKIFLLLVLAACVWVDKKVDNFFEWLEK